jgi:hypothetical protein
MARQSVSVVDLHPGALARFIRATSLLAMSAAQQEGWLVAFSGGLHVDELALDWDAGWSLSEQWVELGWLSADDASGFRPIDDALTAMSGKDHADLWTIDALHSAAEWNGIRELATTALFRL